jgi:hypothetical protein
MCPPGELYRDRPSEEMTIDIKRDRPLGLVKDLPAS